MQKFINYSFHLFALIIAIISLLNIPNFAVATKGSGTLWSYAMLVPALLMTIYFSFRRFYDFNNSLTLLFITILTYLLLGVINMLIWEESELTAGGRQIVEDWTYILRVMLQTLLVTIAVYKYTLYIHQRGYMHTAINVFTAVLLFGAIITILSPFLGFYSAGFFRPEFNNTSSLTRPAGFYMNPNSAGYHAVVALLLSVSILLREKGSRILAFVMILLSLLSAFITLSKGAILMSLIVLVSYFGLGTVYFNRLYKTNRRSLVIVGSLVIFSLAQFVVFLMSKFNELGAFEQSRLVQIMDLLGGKVNTETTTNRSDIAATGLKWIAEAPFFGWGFGAFHYIRHGGDAGIHNMFLMLIGESGIIPMLLYIVFFIFGIYKSMRIKNMEYRFLSLTFFLFTLFFANGNHNLFDNYEVGFMFGFICALSRVDSLDRLAEDEEIDEDSLVTETN
ncbi:MAG: O-antigen ligase family protein [Saprospiraceae bacterium]|nr:O-antigen ligase family protein [Saprospiraceae bacterium]